jgi:hypothetical protein
MPRKPKERKICNHPDGVIVLFTGPACPLCAFKETFAQIVKAQEKAGFFDKEIEERERGEKNVD